MTKNDAIKICRALKAEAELWDEDEAGKALDMAIEALQTDIVRCGECKHLMPDGRCWKFADDAIRPSASDFCSYGERKGGEKE